MSKVSPFSFSGLSASKKDTPLLRKVADHKKQTSADANDDVEVSGFFGVKPPEFTSTQRKRIMSETDEKLMSSTAASEQESQQQKLKISVNGDPKFSLSVSGLNHRLICHFTQAVSVLGKRQFIESMLLHLDNDSLNYICESTQLNLYDNLGRTSYFYILLGDVQIPVFQPGSIMFTSAVKANSPRAKCPRTLNSPNQNVTDGAANHSNGLILSTRDALFLARFLARLAKTYVSLCEQSAPVLTYAGSLRLESPIRTESSMSENCEQELSSPESIPSPVKKQATMSSILYRDSPSPIKPEPVGELERLRFDVYVEALTTVLEEFSEEDVLEYGRILEYKDILLCLNDRFVESLPEKYLKANFEDVDPVDAYIKYWKDFFKPEGAIQFEEKGYEIVKHLLLNTKGIFHPPERYEIFETSMDSLLEFMKKNYKLNGGLEKEPFEQAKPKDRPTISGNSQHIEMSASQASITDILKKYGVTHEIDFTKNEFLCEYYLFMKKRFTGLFLASLVDQEEIFVRKDWAVGVGLKSVCSMVPVFGDLLKIAGITMVAFNDMSVKRKLERISDLAVNYTDLPERLARIMVLLRINAIMAVAKTKVKLKGKSMISEALEQMGIKNKLTRPQLLAFNDSKIVEGAMLVLIETKQINVVNFPEMNSLLEKVVDVLIKTSSITLTLEGEISDDDQQQTRYTEIVIDKAMLRKNEYLPRNLLRGKEEEYSKYYDRVNSYLKSVTVENLNDILAKIDPMDPKYRPISSLVIKRIRKKEKCVLI